MKNIKKIYFWHFRRKRKPHKNPENEETERIKSQSLKIRVAYNT